jgi:hypothetical protein
MSIKNRNFANLGQNSAIDSVNFDSDVENKILTDEDAYGIFFVTFGH